MHVYTVGTHTPDGKSAIEITHDRAFSSAELEALVCEVLPDAARRHVAELAEKERKRGQVPPELFDVCFIPQIRFSHLYKAVVDLLIERHGFARLVYTATLSVFSLPDLSVRGDSAGDPDGDDRLQALLSDALAAGGLPVVTAEQRDAQEEAKIQVLTPIRRARRAQRAVDRMKATGHNPFKTEDEQLVIEILSLLAEREIAAEERVALEELLPPVLENRPEPADLAASWAGYPELRALAAVLTGEPYDPDAPVESEEEPAEVAEDGVSEPEEAVEEAVAPEEAPSESV